MTPSLGIPAGPGSKDDGNTLLRLEITSAGRYSGEEAAGDAVTVDVEYALE